MACFRGHIIRLEVVRAELRRIETMSAGLKRIGRIGVRLSKVCSVDDGEWLLVSPADPVWVAEDTPAYLTVHSNTDWNIE